MKKLIISAFSFFIAITAFSQNGKDTLELPRRSNEVSLDIGPSFMQTLQLGFEQRIGEKKSIVLFGGFRYSDNKDIKRLGYNAEVQYRSYIPITSVDIAHSIYVKNPLGGLYVGPFLQFKYLEVEGDDDYSYYSSNYGPYKTNYSMFSGGLIVGYKLLLINTISIDTNIGIGMRYSEISGDEPSYIDIFEPGYSGIFPRVQFTIGKQF